MDTVLLLLSLGNRLGEAKSPRTGTEAPMCPQLFPHLVPVPSCGGDVLPGGSAVFPVIPIFFFSITGGGASG